MLKFCEITHSYSIEFEEKDKDCLHVFFISTTGQGDPPYKMREFWKKLLQKNHRSLSGYKFSIFGLGDRGYGDNYNLCARKLRQRLVMLGGEEIDEISLGDEQDQGGCWETYLKEFLPRLKKYISLNKQ